MNSRSSDRPSTSSVVEVVGLAGTGKTTLVTHLVEAGGGAVRRVRLRAWKNLPLLLRNSGLAAAPFLHQVGRMECRRPHRFSLMVQLQTLGDLLDTSRGSGARLLLLDQGPVYMLTSLQRALRDPGPEVRATAADSPIFVAYWERTLQAWAERLDWVIELEAPDEVLRHRILGRGTDHPVARMTSDESSLYFERSRASRDGILAALHRDDRGPRCMRFRTDTTSPEQIVDRVLAEVHPHAAPRRG